MSDLPKGISLRALSSAFMLMLTIVSSSGQDVRQNQVGQFDFYVLSLLWLPSLCNGPVDRGQTVLACANTKQTFIVEGLWPQYTSGYPEFCQKAPRLDRKLISSMLDLMPDPDLVQHDWERHGVCAALSPSEYFQKIRSARDAVLIPDQYLNPKKTLSIAPADVKRAFIDLNPEVSENAIGVYCDKGALSSIKICLDTNLKTRGCSETLARECSRERIDVPTFDHQDEKPPSQISVSLFQKMFGSRWCTTSRSYSLQSAGNNIIWKDNLGSTDVESIVSSSITDARTTTQKSYHPNGRSEDVGTSWSYHLVSPGKVNVSSSNRNKSPFSLSRC
jgi:ribonuclease T2